MLNSKHFIGIHGYMLVYSVASRNSFDMVTIIRDKILNHLVCIAFQVPVRCTELMTGRRVRSYHDCRQ